MADTMRALSALQTLLATNTTGDVSQQDLRDFLVSVAGYVYGVAAVTSSPTTLDADDIFVPVDCSGGAVTINLPAIASNQYKVYIIKALDVSSGNVTIDANASETIDGATTVTLNTQYQSVVLVGGTAEWHIVAALNYT